MSHGVVVTPNACHVNVCQCLVHRTGVQVSKNKNLMLAKLASGIRPLGPYGRLQYGSVYSTADC